MILADKIAELRKKNGWSQEELAGQLGVSRQSVSKWESAASIPDLDKILKLSELFGVSTDYLLKDSGEPEEEALPAVMPAGESMLGTEGSVRAVSLEEANEFLDTVWSMAPRIAAGVSMCILSPVLLILLSCLADQEGGYVISEALAVASGFTVLLVMVAVAVSLFLYCGRKTERFEYLEKEPIELAYGVTGVVEKRKKSYEPSHGLFLIIGIILCILSAIPLFAFGVLDLGGMTGVYGFLLCLLLVAVGVFFLVRTCVMFGSFQKLLEEGDYTREKKAAEKRNETVNTVYWCVVTAIHLALRGSSVRRRSGCQQRGAEKLIGFHAFLKTRGIACFCLFDIFPKIIAGCVVTTVFSHIGHVKRLFQLFQRLLCSFGIGLVSVQPFFNPAGFPQIGGQRISITGLKGRPSILSFQPFRQNDALRPVQAVNGFQIFCLYVFKVCEAPGF